MSTTAPMSANVPPSFGKYRILGHLGRGAMGEVFKAHDPSLDRVVALKTIATDSTVDPYDELVRRFRREAQAVAGLVHRNIVTVYDFGEADGKIFMVMELLDGQDLSEVVNLKLLKDFEAKVDLILQVCDGVAFAHRHEVVHRDLKPANIHRLPNGTVKIMDFGLARSLQSDLTVSGSVLGTPYFMAPEQVRGERVDARSDVFSLGVLFYELLCGQRPFPATALHAVLFQVLEREPEPLRHHAPEIPAAFEPVIAKALAKERAERYQNAGELREALVRAQSESQAQTTQLPPLAARSGPLAPPPLLPSSAATPDPRASAPPSPLSSGGVPLEAFSVTFRQESKGDKPIPATPKSTLLELALAAGIPHFHECGGRARCSTCRVRVLAGGNHLSPRTAEETKLASRLGLAADIRLACQTRAQGPVEIQRLIHDQDDVGLLWQERRQNQGIQEMALAIMACDLRDFSLTTRRLAPYDVTHLLNRFFLSAGEVVLANRGHLQSYRSGGFLAFFGMKGGDARSKCADAVRAALRLTQRLPDLNAYAKRHFGLEFRLDLGLCFGRVVVGELGHPSRTLLTAVGDAPTLANRIAGRNREAGTTILATEELVNVVEDLIVTGTMMPLDDHGTTAMVHEVKDFLKPDVISIVQSSFERLEPHAREAATLFYDLLFQIDPSSRALFAGSDMENQGKMLMSVLAVAVKGLDRIDELRPTLRALGARHVGYGVNLSHFDSVEQALLEMIRRLLGAEFTPEVKLAWTGVYNQLVGLMLETDAA